MQQKNEQSQRIPRPFDFLQQNIGKKIRLELREGRIITGILKSFDIHMNCIIYDKDQWKEEFLVRGSEIMIFRGVKD